VLIDSARIVDHLSWLSWRVPPASSGLLLAYFTALVVAVLPGTRPRWRRAAVGAATTAGLAIASAPTVALAGPGPGQLRVAMLDVGQGEAIAIQTPDGHRLLVDSGGATGTFDVGGRVVAPALWALGIRRLDRLLVTHPDLDHAGGAEVVAAEFRPVEIWEGIPVPGAPEMARLAASATARGIAWREVRAGDRLRLGEVELTIDHPPTPDWERRRARNDDSVVLTVRYRDVELLLTGDAAAEFESAWTPTSRAPIRLLKVAHHGSRSSTSAGFLTGYAPQAAFVSAGPGNLFGHPAAEVVTRIADAHVRLFRTDQDGAIIVETDGRAVEVRTIAGGVWSLRQLAGLQP
jgi:competence protein ComEC